MDIYNIQRHVADLSLESIPRYMGEKESSHSHEGTDALVKYIASNTIFKHMVYGQRGVVAVCNRWSPSDDMWNNEFSRLS
jgi:hypothetical protein